MVWEIENNRLSKEFEFKNFDEAVKFVNAILPLAEKMNHHPDIFIHSYKYVKIILFTHSQNKITQEDYSLAILIDKLI